MLVSLILAVIITIGGFSFTYLFERVSTIFWRAAAGCVIGSAIFGLATFVFAMALGLTPAVVTAALVVTVAPVLVLLDPTRRKAFDGEWNRARGKVRGATGTKALRFLYYAAFGLLFLSFFDRAMVVTGEGIFTGGSNNLGDLPFHLGAIYSFAEGSNFPPQNPNFAGATFSYPFIADLITAAFMKFGAGPRDAMYVQNCAWAFSLLVVFESFVRKFTSNVVAGRIAPLLLLFSGGLGFLWFLADGVAHAKGISDFLNAIPTDYTIGDHFRWGNSMTTLLLTQRSLLLGMPLTVIVINWLWQVFSSDEKPGESEPAVSNRSALAIGALAGTLPLIHLHSLGVLFVVSMGVLLMRPRAWKTLLTFAAGVCIVAVPQLVWSMLGSATRPSEFIAWHFGFDSRDNNVLWFWIKNTGIFIPTLIAGLYLVVNAAVEPKIAKAHKRKGVMDLPPQRQAIGRETVLFYIPFALLFVVANLVKLAPWEWDNIKVLIYWYLMSSAFAAFAISWLLGRRQIWFNALAALAVAVLTFSGAIDVWRTVAGHINYRVFDADAVTLSDRLRASTPPESLFLNAPTFNTAIVLSGRRSLMRYPGHLSSHGIDFREREADVKAMYRGGPEAIRLMKLYGVEYVLISPEERASMGPNEAFFMRYPIIAESGQYRVHRVSNTDER